MLDPATLPECPTCAAHQARKRFLWSRKFWCVVIGMAIPPVTYGLMELPIEHVLAMQFFPMAWGFGEWSLDFVKEVTKMLLAWAKAKAAKVIASADASDA